MYRSRFVPALQVVCVTFSNANIRTACSLTRNVFARNVGPRVCIVTDSGSVRACLPAFVMLVDVQNLCRTYLSACLLQALVVTG